MQLTVNGEQRNFDPPMTVEKLLGEIGLDPRKVAVERNLEIVPKSGYAGVALDDGDRLEIVHFIGGGAPDEAKTRDTQPQADEDTWEVAGRIFSSRLIIGTGKYEDYEVNRLAAEAAGSEIITVAVRRVNLDDPSKPLLVNYLDPKKYTYLPNTAGCFTADDALRTLRLAREAGLVDLGGSLLLLLPCCAVLLYQSLPFVLNSWAVFEGSKDGGGLVAVFLLKTGIPLFCLLLLLQVFSIVHRSIQTLKAP